MGSVSKVYFTRTITPEQVVKMYETLGKELTGKVAVKVHSGEEGNQNYLKPEFWKPMVEHVLTLSISRRIQEEITSLKE